MDTHVQLGLEMIGKVLCNVIRHHHERLDGSGYREGLMGDAISLEGRIVAVADVFDAVVQQQADDGRLDGDCVAELEQVLVAAAVSSDAGADALGDVMFSVDALRPAAS